MTTPPKKRLGKHLLKSRLGQGGMGIVYSAIDERLRRDVAVKILPKEFAASDDAVRRFLREARAAARISHPHVVSIFDVDQEDGFTYLVMELMSGGSVQELLRSGPLDWKRAVQIIADACRGLAAAHAAGLIHRDIKPANLMLTADGSVKVADFGLVKDADASRATLTKAGSLLGTPQYMSPEQCQGEPLDARSDLYSLGATFYALLTGRTPFAGLDPMQTMFAHCSRVFPDPREFVPEIPEPVAEVLHKATERSRADRFRSADEFRLALESLTGSRARTLPVEFRFASCSDTGGTSPGSSGSASKSSNGSGSDFGDVPPTLAHEDPAAGCPETTPELAARTTRRSMSFQRSPLIRQARIAGGAIFTAALILWLIVAALQNDPPALDARAPVNGNDRAELRWEDFSESGSQSGEFAVLWDVPVTSGFVRCVDFSPDATRCFTVGSEAAVREWNIVERRPGRVLTPAGAEAALSAVAVSPDGTLLAAGGADHRVFVWRLGDGSLLEGVTCSSPVNALAFRPDSQRLAIGCESELRVADVTAAGLRAAHVLATSTSSQQTAVTAYMTQCVTYSPDGRWLAATSWQPRSATVWDAETDQLFASCQAFAAQPQSIAFLPERDAVVVALNEYDRTGGISVWPFDAASAASRTGRGTREESQGDTQIDTLGDTQSEIRSDEKLPVLVTTASSIWLQSLSDGHSVISVGGWNTPALLTDLDTGATKLLESVRISASARCLALSRDFKLAAVSGGDSDHNGGTLRILKWRLKE